jgi:hypothetical protein
MEIGKNGEFLMRCARPPKGMPKGPKKKKKKKITIDNTALKHQNFRASNKEQILFTTLCHFIENWQVTARIHDSYTRFLHIATP